MYSGKGTVRKRWIFTILVTVMMSGCALPRPSLMMSVEAPIKETPLTERGVARVSYRLDPTFR